MAWGTTPWHATPRHKSVHVALIDKTANVIHNRLDISGPQLTSKHTGEQGFDPQQGDKRRREFPVGNIWEASAAQWRHGTQKSTRQQLAVDVGDGVAVLELEVALGLRVPLLGRGVRLAALGASVVRACNGTSQAQATTKTMRFCYGYGHGRWTSGTSVR